MKSLKRLNDRILSYASHEYAFWAFGFIAFLSGSLLPLPVDPLFMVLVIQNPKKAVRLSLIGATGITLGGLLMYAIGKGLYHTLGVWLINIYDWQDSFSILQQQLDRWGGLIILLKTFTPLPYKLLALIAGMGSLNVPVFIAASFGGRFLRLMIEAILLRLVSDSLKELLQKHLSLGLGLFFLALLTLTFLAPLLLRIKL